MGDGMRALKLVTIVMGVLIVLGTIGLLVGIARRSATPSAALPTGLDVVLREPEGTRILGMTVIQDRLAVQLQGGGPDRIVVIDPRTGATVGHISVAH